MGKEKVKKFVKESIPKLKQNVKARKDKEELDELSRSLEERQKLKSNPLPIIQPGEDEEKEKILDSFKKTGYKVKCDLEKGSIERLRNVYNEWVDINPEFFKQPEETTLSSLEPSPELDDIQREITSLFGDQIPEKLINFKSDYNIKQKRDCLKKIVERTGFQVDIPIEEMKNPILSRTYSKILTTKLSKRARRYLNKQT